MIMDFKDFPLEGFEKFDITEDEDNKEEAKWVEGYGCAKEFKKLYEIESTITKLHIVQIIY